MIDSETVTLDVLKATVSRELLAEKAATVSRALSGRASVLVLKRDFDHALNDLDASLKLDPRSTEALLRRAAIYGERGDQERMRADQAAAAALAPAAK